MPTKRKSSPEIETCRRCVYYCPRCRRKCTWHRTRQPPHGTRGPMVFASQSPVWRPTTPRPRGRSSTDRWAACCRPIRQTRTESCRAWPSCDRSDGPAAEGWRAGCARWRCDASYDKENTKIWAPNILLLWVGDTISAYVLVLKLNSNSALVICSPLWPENTYIQSPDTATGKLQQVGGWSPCCSTSSHWWLSL